MEYLNKIINGDALDCLRQLPDESVHCCITSPPYFRLRNYNNPQQLGMERTPEEYVEKMVEVFREVRRVLRKDGTLFLNIGDSYTGSGKKTHQTDNSPMQKTDRGAQSQIGFQVKSKRGGGNIPATGSIKAKDLIGIPGYWYLPSDLMVGI